jgi:hypothetical protein
MATILELPSASQPLPPAVISRVLSRFDRTQLSAFITVAIDLLDIADGDADAEEDDPAEANGDETDGNFAEDDPCARFLNIDSGPGCIISDPDKGVDDEAHDPEGI